MSNLVIKQFEIGPLNNFLYLLGDSETKEMTMIDPAWDVPFLLNEAQKDGFTITKILLTHGHPDHVNGIDDVQDKFDIPVYLHEEEPDYYTPPCKNLIRNKSSDKMKVGNLEFDTIHTPGHTPGGQCFKHNEHLIAGDTIFVDGCGRCDLPGGDSEVMYETLFNIICELPDDTIIYPGHNYGPTPTDTIGHQKETNPFLTSEAKEIFLRKRNGL